jgi:hypothetical protein
VSIHAGPGELSFSSSAGMGDSAGDSVAATAGNNMGDTDNIPGLGQYEDFHTIDWQRDIARDRMRHR